MFGHTRSDSGALGDAYRYGEVPPDKSDFDVIVVGGGPGGSGAAYNSLNGCKVLLIEKGVWPRDKVCGDAVGGKSLSHVEELEFSP